MANAKLPWFPFYARDWLTDISVRTMDLECRGAYLELLCLQWENGFIPEDCADVATTLGYQSVEARGHFRGLWANQLEKHFPEHGDERRNERLEQLRNEKLFKREKQQLGAASTNAKRDAKRDENRSVRASDLKTDSDADEEEEMSLAAGNGGATPKEIVERWNELAEKYDLTKVRRLSPARLASARRRLGEVTGLWDELEEAIGQRGTWARSRRFPSFDQAMRPTTLMKLLEGNYAARPGEEQDDERSGLIKRLQGFAGTAWKSGTLISTGISYMHSDAPWSDLLTTQLQEIIGDLERR